MADTDGEPEVAANIDTTPPVTPAPVEQKDDDLRETVKHIEETVNSLTETVAAIASPVSQDVSPVKPAWVHRRF